ncbi:MAG TPA: MFS transporter [Burkholderiaceae bacterium]|nr:MFS transporter [Burkholderiaceae bacterium]
MPPELDPAPPVAAAALHAPPRPLTANPRPLVAIILGQICLHAGMAGLRVAAPLQALTAGYSAWAVGVLLALFAAAPVVFAMKAGRLSDKYGYHRPLRLAVGLCAAGGLLACLSQAYAVLCVAAVLCGTGANTGMITIQRSAGRLAGTATERIQVFSWLGLAPAIANMTGAILAGVLIDGVGFRAAFGALGVLPLAALVIARHVPNDGAPAPVVPGAPESPHSPRAPRRAAWDLLRSAPLRRLMLVNWLLSASWDVHSFVLPVLGHARGMSASAIGTILGLFALAVAAVRLALPMIAHRLQERRVLVGAMLSTAAVFAVYPLMPNDWLMAVCAVLLGLSLGSVQPMIMSTLHHITPPERHGEAIALRSMAINASSAAMPLLFGMLGAALGAGALFWAMGLAVAGGSFAARRV